MVDGATFAIARKQIPLMTGEAFRTVTAALEAGLDTALITMGDSTSNETDEACYLLAQNLAALYPSVHVRYKVWNDVSQAYDASTVIQAASGERGIAFTGGTPRRVKAADCPEITGAIDIRVKLAMPNWVPGVLTAVAARYGGSGNFGWAIGFETNGRVRLWWSPEGTTANTLSSTSATGFANAATGWIRATFNPVDGVSHFYSSTDGVTWVSLGDPAPVGATTLFGAPAQNIQYGGRNTANFLTGTLYTVEVRDGVDGPITNPQPITCAYILDETDTSTLTGSTTLFVVNASKAGADYAYWSDTTRFPKAVPRFHVGAFILSMGLNNNGDVGPSELVTSIDTMADLIEARLPTMSLIATTQNPKIAPATNPYQHGRRQYMMAATMQRRGCWSIIDTYRAFIRDARGLAVLLDPDGIHGSAAGGGRTLLGSAYTAPIALGKA